MCYEMERGKNLQKDMQRVQHVDTLSVLSTQSTALIKEQGNPLKTSCCAFLRVKENCTG